MAIEAFRSGWIQSRSFRLILRWGVSKRGDRSLFLTGNFWIQRAIVIIVMMGAMVNAEAASLSNRFLKEYNRRYLLAVTTNSFLYKQGGVLALHDEEVGLLPGLQFFVSTIDGGWYYAADIRYFYGRNRFTGSYVVDNTETAYAFTEDRKVTLIKGRIGKPFEWKSAWFTPYVQLGFYMWDREVPGPNITHGATTGEMYQHIDASIGLKYDVQLASHWMLEAFGSLGRAVMPHVSVNVNGVTTQYNNLDLGAGPIIEYGVNSYYQMAKGLDLAVGTSVETFRYKQSTSVVANNTQAYALNNLGSTTLMWKASIGFSWRFEL